jgi:hypothetical protein
MIQEHAETSANFPVTHVLRNANILMKQNKFLVTQDKHNKNYALGRIRVLEKYKCSNKKRNCYLTADFSSKHTSVKVK